MNPFSETLVRRLARARRVAVLTGAGVSAESGIPTFRDAGGYWEGLRPEEMASAEGMLRRPAVVQAWYRHRRRILHEARPNAGHEALAALERMTPDFLLITQNVDGLHQRAGSERVAELHGSLAQQRCMACGRDAPGALLDEAEGALVRCPACGGLIRPGVVWFGEALPAAPWARAAEAAGAAEVFLSVGTSAVVYPAAGLPALALRSGAYVAEINTEPSAIAGGLSEVVLGPSATVLPALVAAVRALRERHPADW